MSKIGKEDKQTEIYDIKQARREIKQRHAETLEEEGKEKVDEVIKKLLKVKKKVRYFNYREKNFESGSKTIFCTYILKEKEKKDNGKNNNS